jgi:hypothetical protein
MTIRTDQEWNTDSWVGKERMHPPPNWYGTSPEVIARRGRPWNQDPTDVPWLDREDAEEQIQARLDEDLITAQEAALLVQWVKQGYFILENTIEDHALLDVYRRDLDGVWTAEQASDGLQIMSLHIDGRPPGPIEHAEILSWPLEERIRLRDTQHWRIHYHHPHTSAGFEITRAKKLLRMTHLILDEAPTLLTAIGFKYGSQVSLHQDLCTAHVHPASRLVGAWVACEDVNPDAGPLSVYPGSHKVPMWPGWRNYPQTNLRTCHMEMRYKDENYLRQAIEGSEWTPLVIKKGDVIFQHGLLIHGGEKIRDHVATRFSMVLHYTVPGGDRMHEVEGPFNW